MKKFTVQARHIRWSFLLFASCLLLQQPVHASPFGAGKFGEMVPFGSLTSMDLSIGSDVSFTLAPSGGNLEGQGSNTLTVTSTDVVGHYLWLYAPTSTSLVGGSDTIPASSNTSAASLSTNTWGYNTSGSTTNYIGVTGQPVIIEDATGPYESGHNVTVYYGVLVDGVQAAKNYSTDVVFTLAGKF